jgi:hypothetical protein
MSSKLVKAPETLWYEDQEGTIIPHVPGETPFHKKELYQHTRSVSMRHHVLGAVSQKDVDACTHDETRMTGGWVDGVEGRECRKCKGTQTRHVGEAWPEKWEGGSCYTVVEMTAGWDDNVVTAMVRSGDYTARDAALISATACERCWNVLLDWYQEDNPSTRDEVDNGYRIGSDEEGLAGTSCILCDEVTAMCQERAVPCRGNHDFEEELDEEDSEWDEGFLDNEGKPLYVCRHCGCYGVELDDLTMRRHLDAGGDKLPSIVSETVYKYKVRGRVDKYTDSPECKEVAPGDGCCCCGGDSPVPKGEE